MSKAIERSDRSDTRLILTVIAAIGFFASSGVVWWIIFLHRLFD